MNKLPIAKSVAREYLKLQKRLRTNKKLVEYIKIWVIGALFLFFLGVYIYFVNQGSTLGFFLREEQRTLDKIEFEYSLIAIQNTEKQKMVRESVMSGNKYLDSEKQTKNFTLDSIIFTVVYTGDKLDHRIAEIEKQ